MKKTLLTLAAALTISATAFASTVTYNVDDATSLQGTETAEKPAEGSSNGMARHIQPLESLQLGDYSFAFSTTNTNASSAPAYYWAMSTNENQQKTIRLYNGSSMTITAPAGTTFGKITLEGSNGKDGMSITASAGSATGSSKEVSWSNSEAVSTVTLTFSSSFRITKVTFDTEAGSGVTPPATSGLIDVDFKTSLGGFTFEQGTLPEGLSYVWAQDTKYGLKASAYLNGTNFPTDAWAVSPVFELKDVESPVLTFSQAVNKFLSNGSNIAMDDVFKMVSVCVREENGEWVALSIPTLPTSQSWNFVESGEIDLSAYLGKKIQIGFHYTSTAETAGTWEIAYAKVAGKGTVTPPVTPPATGDYDILVNNATEIDGDFVEEVEAVGSSYGTAAHYQPLTSCVIGDYYFSFSTTSDKDNQAPALYLPMSTNPNGNSNFRTYVGTTMTISAPEGKLMTAIAIDGSNADSGLTIKADKGECTLDGNKGNWTYAEGTNTVALTFDKKYRMYGFNITLKGGSSVDEIEDAVVITVDGNNIIAPDCAKVYNLNGVQTGRTDLASGIYIVRCGSKAVKVLVK